MEFVGALANKQLFFLGEDVKEEQMISLESAIDRRRDRYGHFPMQRALMLKDKPLKGSRFEE